MIKSQIVLISFLFVKSIYLLAQNASKENSLKDDAYLHPIDCVTPYTLKKNEWIFAQSLQTLPFPSWAFWGVTDKITLQIDLLPWLVGFFTELKKPVPSFNIRYRFNEQKKSLPTIGIEAMFVYIWDTLKRFNLQNTTIYENGAYYHLKSSASYRLKDFYINFSAGIDYMYEILFKGIDPNHEFTNVIRKTWNPNCAIGFDYRPSNWISYHTAFTYGSTLTFLENVPRKIQLTYGFRIAPFYRNKFAILRNMRIELVAINAFFKDANDKQIFPVPLFPYFYWQWKREKKSIKDDETNR